MVWLDLAGVSNWSFIHLSVHISVICEEKAQLCDVHNSSFLVSRKLERFSFCPFEEFVLAHVEFEQEKTRK